MASIEPDELRKIWGLSLYEQHRKPQAAITDNTGIAVCPRNLHSEFMCPICLGLLKKTMITKECLHRFCSDCLVTALTSGNKECPSCRNKIVSKNSVRADPNFDLLISKVYPDRDDYEADQDRVLENVNKSEIQVALVNSMNEGIRLQNQNRHKRKKLSVNPETVTVSLSVPVSVSADVPRSEHASPATTNSRDQATLPPDTPQPLIILGASSLDDTGGEESASEGEGLLDAMSLSLDEIEIVFLPKPAVRGFPSVNRGRLRYLKTSANSTVDDLSKFLATQYALECGSEVQEAHPNFCIYGSPVPGLFVALNGTQNLRQVYDKFSGNEIILELFYSCQKT